MILRTGIDLIEIQRLAELNPAIRQRFLERVFTPGELADCCGSDAKLSGRFAVKEAVAKVLGTGIGPVRWQDIEVRNDVSGAPQLHLHGTAARFSEQQGLTAWSISITHAKSHAAAVAVAWGEGLPPGSSQQV